MSNLDAAVRLRTSGFPGGKVVGFGWLAQTGRHCLCLEAALRGYALSSGAASMFWPGMRALPHLIQRRASHLFYVVAGREIWFGAAHFFFDVVRVAPSTHLLFSESAQMRRRGSRGALDWLLRHWQWHKQFCRRRPALFSYVTHGQEWKLGKA